ncbi:MAG: family 43 glycosylhydrolase [Arcanobacterium sp.]|nr:family 43 glycosylhydrolase [Arcanobacterium sp.]MDY5589337.1 family 43 glycosylhydrolase [Arcanobacterium sp.]
MQNPSPVFAGMNPDPTWIWDSDFSSAVALTSSFEFVPGLPIYKGEYRANSEGQMSFCNWQLVGHAVDVEMARALLLDFVGESGGLYAPTIRKLYGHYVIACTVARIDESQALASGVPESYLEEIRKSQGNFILVSAELSGPWNGPFWVTGAGGIDPDLFQDQDGAIWWTQTRLRDAPEWSGQTEIVTAPIDLEKLMAPQHWTFEDGKWPIYKAELASPLEKIWTGFGEFAVWAEAPHLFRIGDWIYLFTAEGGTSFEHSEMCMRIYAPAGLAQALSNRRGFYPNPANPVLTRRDLGRNDPIQNLGHVDILQTPDGQWWALALAVRKDQFAAIVNRDVRLNFYGRETFLVAIEWQRSLAAPDREAYFLGVSPSSFPDEEGWPILSLCEGLETDECSIGHDGQSKTIENLFRGRDIITSRKMEGFEFVRLDSLPLKIILKSGEVFCVYRNQEVLFKLVFPGYPIEHGKPLVVDIEISGSIYFENGRPEKSQKKKKIVMSGNSEGQIEVSWEGGLLSLLSNGSCVFSFPDFFLSDEANPASFTGCFIGRKVRSSKSFNQLINYN